MRCCGCIFFSLHMPLSLPLIQLCSLFRSAHLQQNKLQGWRPDWVAWLWFVTLVLLGSVAPTWNVQFCIVLRCFDGGGTNWAAAIVETGRTSLNLFLVLLAMWCFGETVFINKGSPTCFSETVFINKCSPTSFNQTVFINKFSPTCVSETVFIRKYSPTCSVYLKRPTQCLQNTADSVISVERGVFQVESVHSIWSFVISLRH